MTVSESKHSFIVCAYKKSPYLRDCIQSLMNQTVPSFIKIVTSTPNEYIEKTAAEFGLEVVVNPQSEGIAADWNFALKQCDTQYCTLAHQDDLYESEYTEKMLQEMTAGTLIGFSDYYELRGDEKSDSTINLKIKRFLLGGLKNKSKAGSKTARRRVISLGNSICCPAVTYNMRKIPQNLFKPGMRSNVDWQAWEQLSRMDGEFQYVTKPLMCHRIHEQSETSQTIKDNQRTGEDMEMFRKFWPAPFAFLIGHFYALSEKSNDKK